MIIVIERKIKLKIFTVRIIIIIIIIIITSESKQRLINSTIKPVFFLCYTISFIVHLVSAKLLLIFSLFSLAKRKLIL